MALPGTSYVGGFRAVSLYRVHPVGISCRDFLGDGFGAEYGGGGDGSNFVLDNSYRYY